MRHVVERLAHRAQQIAVSLQQRVELAHQITHLVIALHAFHPGRKIPGRHDAVGGGRDRAYRLDRAPGQPRADPGGQKHRRGASHPHRVTERGQQDGAIVRATGDLQKRAIRQAAGDDRQVALFVPWNAHRLHALGLQRPPAVGHHHVRVVLDPIVGHLEECHVPARTDNAHQQRTHMRLLLLARQQVSHSRDSSVFERVRIFGGANLERLPFPRIERAGEEDIDRNQHDRRTDRRKHCVPKSEPDGQRASQPAGFKS